MTRHDYIPDKDRFDELVPAGDIVQRSELGADGGVATLDDAGLVEADQLGTGTPNALTALYATDDGAREWRAVNSRILDHGRPLGQQGDIDVQGDLTAEEDAAGGRIVLSYDPDFAGQRRGMDVSALVGAWAHWRATSALVGSTSLPDRLGHHAGTLSAAYADLGALFPGPDDLRLVSSDTYVSLADTATLLDKATAASCWLAGWICLDGAYIRNQPNPPYRVLFTAGTMGDVTTNYVAFQLYVDYPGKFVLGWQHPTNGDVTVMFPYLLPVDEPVFFAIVREDLGTETACSLWLQGALKQRQEGLSTVPSEPGVWRQAMILNTGLGFVGDGIRFAELAFGARAAGATLPGSAEWLAQYRRGYPQPAFLKLAGHIGGQRAIGAPEAGGTLTLQGSDDASDHGTTELQPDGGTIGMSGADSVEFPTADGAYDINASNITRGTLPGARLPLTDAGLMTAVEMLGDW